MLKLINGEIKLVDEPALTALNMGQLPASLLLLISADRMVRTVWSYLICGAICLVAIMAMAVGILCITNRRVSDPGMVGWLVGLLFALPFVRRIMPGDPPIGCLLDVAVFSWSLLLCVVAMLLALIAWLRQSRAAQQATNAS